MTLDKSGKGLQDLRGMRRISARWMVLAAGLSVLATVGSASANNFYGATGLSGCNGNMQDNKDMTWFRTSGLTANMRTAVGTSLNNEVSPTAINLLSERVAADAFTDVVYLEANYSSYCGQTFHPAGSTVGYTSCNSLNGSRCERFDIRLDQSWDVSALATQTKRQNLATHETGHSLGLIHPTAGNGAPTGTVMADWTIFVAYSISHETDHLNANYP